MTTKPRPTTPPTVGLRIVAPAWRIAQVMRDSAASNPLVFRDARSIGIIAALGNEPLIIEVVGSGPNPSTTWTRIMRMDGTDVEAGDNWSN